MSARRVLPLAVLAAIVFAGTGALVPVPLLLLDVTGNGTVRLVLPENEEFVYRYRHSVYGVVVEERFRVAADGLRQVEIQSSDRRALEYYGFPYEPRPREGGYITPGNPETIPEIRLAVLRDQQQTIVLGARAFDLSGEFGDARLVVRAVTRPLVFAR